MRISRTLKRAPASSMAPQTRGRMYESMMCPRSSTSLLAMVGSFAMRGYALLFDSVASAAVRQEQIRVGRVLVAHDGVGVLLWPCGGEVQLLAGDVALLVARAPPPPSRRGPGRGAAPAPARRRRGPRRRCDSPS